MQRFLVAAVGVASGEWFFIALCAHWPDAKLVASQWRGAEIFDLAKLQFPEWFE